MSRRLPPGRFQQARKAGLPAIRRASPPQPHDAVPAGGSAYVATPLPPGLTLG
jgi:hypothetical protein